jgi:integrase
MSFQTIKNTQGVDVCSSHIENYKSCQIWLEGYNSPYTKKAYKFHLSLFCEHHNINPDSLIQLNPDQVKAMVLNYIVHLKKVAKQSSEKPRPGEISVNSIKTYLAGVQSFLEFNDIVLNWKKIARYYPEPVTNNLRAYTKEEIAKLLTIADIRDRCVILLMASTGMRVGAVKSLKLRHLTRLQSDDDQSNIALLSVYHESKSDRYTALVTPECMVAIDEYIDYRKKQHEKITDESYIVRDKYATFSKNTNRPSPVAEQNINKQIKYLLRKAGLSYVQLQPDHSLRRFFNTCLMNSNVAYSFKELLMGHSVKLDDTYYDKDSETSRQKIIVEYMKAVDALTINEEYKLKKKIGEYEDKLKDAPKIGELESHLAAKIIEQDALKKQVEVLQLEKQNETKAMQQKYELEMKAMHEQMNYVISIIQQNPMLAQVKPEALCRKSLGSS